MLPTERNRETRQEDAGASVQVLLPDSYFQFENPITLLH
jgi:hypothetical protein